MQSYAVGLHIADYTGQLRFAPSGRIWKKSQRTSRFRNTATLLTEPPVLLHYEDTMRIFRISKHIYRSNECIYGIRERNVAARDRAHVVRPRANRHRVPRDRDVGMVVEPIRLRGDGVHERD
jgi:hypothetical protein